METQAADRLLSSQELADYLGVPIDTLYIWRARGIAPPAYRVGRFTRYRKGEVDTWLESRALIRERPA